MIRRTFLTILFPSLASRKRRIRARAVTPRVDASAPNLIEKAQLLASYSDAEIQTALTCRFLEIWSPEELRAELAARPIRRKQV